MRSSTPDLQSGHRMPVRIQCTARARGLKRLLQQGTRTDLYSRPSRHMKRIGAKPSTPHGSSSGSSRMAHSSFGSSSSSAVSSVTLTMCSALSSYQCCNRVGMCAR
eukprot:239665-Hanusia_phi.AAC.3